MFCQHVNESLGLLGLEYVLDALLDWFFPFFLIYWTFGRVSILYNFSLIIIGYLVLKIKMNLIIFLYNES